MLAALERKFLYFPTPWPDQLENSPGRNWEDVYFRSEDGLLLHGWLHRKAPSKPIILYSHGNAGNISDRLLELNLWLDSLEVSIFIYDYRGYGRSEGRPHEAGLHLDSMAAYRWLRREAGYPGDQIIIKGRSLGGAVAVQLARRVPHRGVILENTFTSLAAMAKLTLPWLPSTFTKGRFDSLSAISQLKSPLLVCHATDDSVVPFAMGRQLYNQASCPKTFLPLAGLDHNAPPPFQDATFAEAVAKFVE